jgi:hypothetical protein
VGSESPVTTSSPSQTAAPSFAAIPGLSFDVAQAWAEGFGLDCQTGLFPPNRTDDLVIALCQRQSAADNARVDLTIQYWPNNTVLAVSEAVQPISGGDVSSNFRIAFLNWASGLSYSRADSGAALDWLLAKQDCSSGCSERFGPVSWTHTTAGSVEAVSSFVGE